MDVLFPGYPTSPIIPTLESLLKGPVTEADPFQEVLFDKSPTPSALASTGLDTRRVRVNQAFADLFRCDSNEIKSVKALALALREEELDGGNGLLHFDYSNGEDNIVTVDRKLRRKDGGIFVGRISKSLVSLNGNGQRVLYATVQDVTDIWLAEQSRAESDRRFIDLMSRLPVGVILTRKDGTFTYVNPAAFEILGDSPVEIGNRDTRRLYEDLGVRETFKELMRKQGVVEDFRAGLKRRDGTVVPCSITAVDQHNAAGETIGSAWIFVDVTKEIEARELEMTLALHEANQAGRATAMRETLHEVRTPLSSMPVFIELAQRCLANDDPERTKEYLGRLEDLVKELTRRVKSLGEDTLSENEQQRFCFEETNTGSVTHLLAEAIEPLGLIAKREGLAFTFNNETPIDTTSVVSVDAQKLKSVLTNLVTNASKYTIEGSISVTVGVDSDCFIIKCTDTGRGIPDDELDRIFDQNFRASNIGGVPGSGLGLSIAKKVVDAHGGRIEVQSEVEKGSTFVVSLPLVKK